MVMIVLQNSCMPLRSTLFIESAFCTPLNEFMTRDVKHEVSKSWGKPHFDLNHDLTQTLGMHQNHLAQSFRCSLSRYLAHLVTDIDSGVID